MEFLKSVGTWIIDNSNWIGLLLSVVLIWLTARVNSKISNYVKKQETVENFNKNRKSISVKLNSYQENISKDFDDISESDAKYIITRIQNTMEKLTTYNSLLKWNHKLSIKLIKLYIKNGTIDKTKRTKVCSNISKLIVKCETQEVFKYEKR